MGHRLPSIAFVVVRVNEINHTAIVLTTVYLFYDYFTPVITTPGIVNYTLLNINNRQKCMLLLVALELILVIEFSFSSATLNLA